VGLSLQLEHSPARRSPSSSSFPLEASLGAFASRRNDSAGTSVPLSGFSQKEKKKKKPALKFLLRSERKVSLAARPRGDIYCNCRLFSFASPEEEEEEEDGGVGEGDGAENNSRDARRTSYCH